MRRGIALLATAFITMIAAGAAIVVIKLTLDATRVESAKTERDSAKADGEAVRAEFEEALAEAPYFFYSEVFAYERARVCTQDGGAVYEPGSSWPAACGTTWGYQQAADGEGVRVEIQAPSIDDPRLRLRILSDAGRSEWGVETFYAPMSPARWALYSEGNLELDELPGGTNELGGEIYAGGVINLPEVELTMGSGLVAGEGGFDAHPDTSPISENSVRFYGPSTDASGSVLVDDVRELYTIGGDLSGSEAMFAANLDLACPGIEPVVVGAYTSHFCLKDGETLLDTAGEEVVVPSGATAYLLLFGASGANSVDVYYSNKTSQAPDSCGSGCDLAGSSAAALTATTHPGGLEFWTKLETFKLPDDGLIATDRDTHIGLCGSGFTNPSGTCSGWNTPGGMEIAENITVMAGSLVNIVNIYLSGPITTAEDASFGAVASGSVLIPYWARPEGGDLTIEGSYVGLGLGIEGASVAVHPAVIETSSNTGGRLTVNGGLAGVDVDTSFQLYESVTILGSGRYWTSPPPLYPAYAGTWQIVATRTLPSIEICGAIVCSGW